MLYYPLLVWRYRACTEACGATGTHMCRMVILAKSPKVVILAKVVIWAYHRYEHMSLAGRGIWAYIGLYRAYTGAYVATMAHMVILAKVVIWAYWPNHPNTGYRHMGIYGHMGLYRGLYTAI